MSLVIMEADRRSLLSLIRFSYIGYPDETVAVFHDPARNVRILPDRETPENAMCSTYDYRNRLVKAKNTTDGTQYIDEIAAGAYQYPPPSSLSRRMPLCG